MAKRRLIATAVVLALTAMALGDYTITLTSDGPTEVEFNWTGSFQLAVGILADLPVWGIQYNMMLEENGTLSGEGHKINIRKVANGSLFGADLSNGYHSDSQGNFIDRFAPSEIVVSSLTYPPLPQFTRTLADAAAIKPEAVLYNPTLLDKQYGYRGVGEVAGRVDGSLLIYQIDITEPLAPGLYEFTVGDGGFGVGIIPANTTEFAPLNIAPFELFVGGIPEPATATLLLAGAPFVRRRRQV